MKFISRSLLFLIFFLLPIQSVHSFQQPSQALQLNQTTTQDLISSTNEKEKCEQNNLIQKLDWCKQKIKNLFSKDNQSLLVNFYQLFNIILPTLKALTEITNNNVLSPIPSGINQALTKMNFPAKKVFLSKAFGFNAMALLNYKIVVGKDLLDACSNKELEFVVGHEIAHIQHNHVLKSIILTGVLSMALPITLVVLEDYVQRIKEKYSGKSRILDKAIVAFEKCRKFLNENPLVCLIYTNYIASKIIRYHEKDADLTSAQKTGQISGGITFFERMIKMDNEEAQLPIQFWNYLNPFYMIRTIHHYFFPSHPSHEERIAYLKALQQN